VVYEVTHMRRMSFKLKPSPAQAHSFQSVLLQGAVISWTLPPDGLGEILTVLMGEVWVVVCLPRKRRLIEDIARPDHLIKLDTFESHVGNGEYEAVVLKAGQLL
jgi:hypothetical protein